MELAVIIATIVVVILQIITIAKLKETKKEVSDQAAKINQALTSDRSGEKRDRDFRSQNNRRPGNDQRPRPSAQSQAQAQPQAQQPAATGSVDTVEKSLRDINLKLKNAERDQEFARRKVQENFNKDPNRRNERNDRNDRNPRGGNRDNRDNRDSRDRDNRDHRDSRDNRPVGNRDRRSGGNWQERNKSREPLNFGDNPQGDESQIQEKSSLLSGLEQPSANVAEPIAAQVAVADAIASDVDASDLNNDDSLQHGRKILVKRRALKDGESASDSVETEGSSESIQSASSENSAKNESSDSEGSSSEGEIKFGRR